MQGEILNELLNYVPANGLLQDRVILVTGAAMGIGRAVALACGRFGATVVLLDKNNQLLEETYDEILAAGLPEPVIAQMDMQTAEPEAYEHLVQSLYGELGRLDGLVLNAAFLGAFMPIKMHDVALWDQMLKVNLTANFYLSRACIPLLELASDPAIVVSSDTSDKVYYGAYGVSKAALDALMRLLAAEHDQDACFIRVNAIDTGPVRTRLRVLNFPGEVAESLVLPQSVVGSYLYFLGPDAGKRTGERIACGRLPADWRWPGEQQQDEQVQNQAQAQDNDHDSASEEQS